MTRQTLTSILFLLFGATLILPASAQDDLLLKTPKPIFYGVGQIGHSIVPASVEQAARLVRQGDVLRKAGNPEAAQKLYRDAIAIAPLVEAYFHYADFLAAKGSPAKAAEIYRYVMPPLTKTPESQGSLRPIELFRLALYLSEAGETQEALHVYQYAAYDSGGPVGSLPKLEFINKHGFNGVLFMAACHLGTGFALANCTDPDYPTVIPTERKEIMQATRIKPDWAKSWLALATEMEEEVSESYHSQQISDNIQLGRRAAINYLAIAKRPNSGETTLNIEIVESWRDRWFNPAWMKSKFG